MTPFMEAAHQRIYDFARGSGPTTNDAAISEDGKRRYALTRYLGGGSDVDGTVAWCMLNPSTADSNVDDATIRRVLAFSRQWRYERVLVVNLWSLRATDPNKLLAHPREPDPCHADFLKLTWPCDETVVAWGSFASHRQLRYQLLDSAQWLPAVVSHLGLTAAGHPRHPLYLRGDTTRKFVDLDELLEKHHD